MQIKSVKIQFDKLLAETHGAYLIKICSDQIWIPKKLCRRMLTNKKLGGNVSIPAWLYIEKFGKEPSSDIADLIIEHHVPEKITPTTVSTHESLIKPPKGKD